jgi:hypothetical protein
MHNAQHSTVLAQQEMVVILVNSQMQLVVDMHRVLHALTQLMEQDAFIAEELVLQLLLLQVVQQLLRYQV